MQTVTTDIEAAADLANSFLLKADVNRRYPLVERGDGVFLYDTDNHEYLDGSSGAIVANIGHGVQEIADAASAQASRIAYTYRTQFANQKAEELASKIIKRAGDKAAAFFLSSGSEASEAAIRLVIQYWRERGRPQKRRILSRRISYHGNTLGAISLSSDMRRQELSGMLIEEPIVAPSYCYRCPFGKEPRSCQIDCAQHLEDAILSRGAENVAAFIVEPIVGATGGAIAPHREYFKRVREICDRYDVLLVADEVITGFGRTGKWFGMHHWGVSADLAILGKGLNAGYTPLSAVLLSEHVVTAITEGSGRVTIGHTHSCNPLSAAICCAVIDYVETHNLVDRARFKGAVLRGALKSCAQDHPFVGDVRGMGLLWAVEFVSNRETKEPFPPEAKVTDRIVELAFENGLIVYPCRGLINANQGDAILIAPPLVIKDCEIEILAERLDRTLRAFRAQTS